MSRLQALAIPFVGGHTDEVDEKLLPNGVFADVSNGRIPAAGSLRLRRGWRPLTMLNLANGETLTAHDLFSFGETLLALCRRASGTSGARTPLCLATYTQSNATRPWVLNTDSGLTPATQVRAVGAMPEMATSVASASAALTSDGVYGCIVQSTTTTSVFRVFKRDNDETVAYGELANNPRVRKVVSMGSTFGLVENTGSALILLSLNPSGTAPAWASVGTLFSATVTWFDVAVAFDSAPGALHIADVVAGAASYRQFTFAGAQTGATKTITAGPVETVSLCSNDTVVEYVYQDDATHELSLLSFSGVSPYTTAAGPTAVNAGQAIVEGLYCVGLRAGSAASNPDILIASEHSAGANDLKEVSLNIVTSHLVHSLNGHSITLGQQLCGGFIMRDSVWAVGHNRRPTGTGVSGATGATSMYLDSLQAPWFYVDFGNAAQQDFSVRTPFWPGQAPTGDALVLLPRDNTPNTSVTPRTLTTRSLKILSGERRPAAEVNGGLYITGGILNEWVAGLNDNGQLFPIIVTLAGSNSTGTLANGVYQYRAVMIWEDEKKNTHRSIVSGPAQTTLAGANDTITATVYAAKTLRRNSNLITNPRIELYRTEAGPGELFYLVGSGAVATTTDTVTIVDLLPDASIIDEPLLYTQGETGATSGILDQAPARPSSFVAGTKRRLILGSAGTSYQWSQISFPETPQWFAEPGVSGDAAQAYFDDVEGGRITGVAALDEVVFVGTAERLYVTGGTGPNLAGTGEFSPPTELPADTGFFNALSILETSEGLWFLGSLNTFYLLARGTPTPELSRAVQDRLVSPVVGCGYDHTDNVATWAMAGASAAASALIVRQLDTKQWFGDTLPFIPIALHGHRGQLYAIASDGVVWQQSDTAYGDGASGATVVALRVATGQIGPFEMAGWGRLAVVELLGEFQAAAAILAEISYDDGLSWTPLGTHTVTGLAAGTAFQRQWYPARQRGDRFRVRFTMTPSVTTTEGCRLTGCVVQYSKRSGPTRLDSAKRK